jgi:hypothetical protein
MRSFLRKRGVWRTLGAAGAALLSGCFSYIPAEPGSVREGQQVRVYLGRDALDGLVELPTQAPFVTGTLMRSDPDRFLLRVPVAARQRGFMVESLGQDVFIRTDQVVQLERREVNRLGTGLLTLGGTAVVGAVIYMIIDGALFGERPLVPPDNEARMPILIFPSR